ncbi:glycosyltransferase [Aquibium carbonis]|uniref:Glycosyltransferase n=2 Tax=Aquibium carbonis TaxID=2495581 RepID=A0A429YJ33_9HYPH|nr:glycosyltransferase [Aquibium carbonis]
MVGMSVIMATYNRGRHILPSIRSVLDQSHRDFELIVVGDCCTDDTPDIVRPLLDARVRWFNLAERCGSQSFPNNEGIRRAEGDLIAYIGHDDIWAPDHLASLDALFAADPDLDVAVAGTIFHGPAGSDFRQVTGLFDDSAAAREHFFPPSSLAHRRDVTGRIGPWRHPMEIAAPVDCDLLLRAVGAGMRFASTRRVSVHKFAAGHRYLSYLRHTSDEQDHALQRLDAPDHAAFVDAEVERARAEGTFMVVRHGRYETFENGALARSNALNKGILRPDLRRLEGPVTIAQDDSPRALDWQPLEQGRFRRVGRNPKPKILLPFCCTGPVAIRIVVTHADRAALKGLSLALNGAAFDARMSRPRQVEDRWEAAARIDARLLPDDYSVMELRLTEAQRMRPGQTGIGIGDIRLARRRLRDRAGDALGWIGRRLGAGGG